MIHFSKKFEKYTTSTIIFIFNVIEQIANEIKLFKDSDKFPIVCKLLYRAQLIIFSYVLSININIFFIFTQY